MSEKRVLVAGGGIGGLATANAFAKAGCAVDVFEQASGFTEIGAAIGIQTNAMKALASFDRSDAVCSMGEQLEHYEYWSWSGKRLVHWPQGEIGRRLGAPNVVIHRADLQAALLAGLDPSIVHLGVRVAGFDEDADGVNLRLTDDSEHRGALLVGADGINSVIRQQVLGETGKRYAGWAALRGIADFDSPLLPKGYARQYLGRGRSFGMWRLPGGRIYWVGTIKVPEGGSDSPTGRKQDVLDWFGTAPPPSRDLIDATLEPAILRNDIIDRKPVDRWSTRRVTLLGDAAHATTPVTGQGGGQAIEDAAVLRIKLQEAGTLGDADALAAGLLNYEQERGARTASIINEAWTISTMHHWTNPLMVKARDLSLKLQPEKVWVKRMEERLGTYTYS